MNNVYSVLKKHLSPDRYCDLGLTFGLDLVEIHQIEKDYPMDCNRQLAEMIQRWIYVSGSASWKTLVHKLMEMDETTLADMIVSLHA